LKAPVSKTGIPVTRYREFESHPIRAKSAQKRNDTAFVATKIDEPDMSGTEICCGSTQPRE
jgi:hypothetical protein